MRMRMENKNKNEILFKNKRNEIMQYNGYSWAFDYDRQMQCAKDENI